jgi:glutamyl-tRNA synthetase
MRALGGSYVLRIEDLDRARALPVEDEQIAAMRHLGLEWDEGPDVGGPYAPYRQSMRGERYERALGRLREQGLVYPCYCSRADVQRAAEAPNLSNQPASAGLPAGLADDGPPYPGTCRELRPKDREERERAGRMPAFRFKVPPGTVRFDDLACGPVAQDVQTVVGDFVLKRADGVFAYQLAVVVDDIEMAMTHVLRGRDLLSSTARQLLLYQALGASPPVFTHVPLLLGSDGSKLSKRNGGALPTDFDTRRVLDALAGLARLSPKRPGAVRDLISYFDVQQIARLEPTLTLSPEDLSS